MREDGRSEWSTRGQKGKGGKEQGVSVKLGNQKKTRAGGVEIQMGGRREVRKDGRDGRRVEEKQQDNTGKKSDINVKK